MIKFIFTFGRDAGGGWAEVTAENERQAIELFSLFHPKKDGIIACCEIYDEADFKNRTSMYRNGNFGRRCVERIVCSHEIIEEEA